MNASAGGAFSHSEEKPALSSCPVSVSIDIADYFAASRARQEFINEQKKKHEFSAIVFTIPINGDVMILYGDLSKWMPQVVAVAVDPTEGTQQEYPMADNESLQVCEPEYSDEYVMKVVDHTERMYGFAA